MDIKEFVIWQAGSWIKGLGDEEGDAKKLVDAIRDAYGEAVVAVRLRRAAASLPNTLDDLADRDQFLADQDESDRLRRTSEAIDEVTGTGVPDLPELGGDASVRRAMEAALTVASRKWDAGKVPGSYPFAQEKIADFAFSWALLDIQVSTRALAELSGASAELKRQAQQLELAYSSLPLRLMPPLSHRPGLIAPEQASYENLLALRGRAQAVFDALSWIGPPMFHPR